MKKLIAQYNLLTTPVRRVFWVVTSITAILIVVSFTLVKSLLSSPTVLDAIGVSAPYFLVLIGIVSSISILTNRIRFGAWLFYGGTVVIMLMLPFIQKGVAIPAAVLVLVVTVLIPLQAFTGRSTTFATILGLTISGSIVVVDVLWTGPRVGIAAGDLRSVQTATLVLALILINSIAALYGSFNLRTKLLFLTLGASLISIIGITASSVTISSQSLGDKSKGSLLTSAAHTADSVDTFIEFNRQLVITEATLPIFRKYLISSTELQLEQISEVEKALIALAARDPKNIGSYSLMDANGIDVMDTFKADVGVDKSNRDYFINPKISGNAYISPVRFSPTSPDHAFYMGAPIYDENHTFIGVLRVRFRSSVLHDLVVSNNGAAGAGSYGILLDEYNIVLADAANPQNYARSLGVLDAAAAVQLQGEYRLLRNLSPEALSLNLNAFANGMKSSGNFFRSNDRGFPSEMQIAVAPLKTQPWKVAFIQPLAVATAPTDALTRTLIIIALGISIFISIGSLFVSQTITTPIARLTETAEQLSAGNLKARASIRSQDELGTLATTFNVMGEQLEETLTGLEHTISIRTAELEQQSQALAQRSQELESSNEYSQRRASQLFAIASVSNAIATIQNLEELLPRITQVINQQFGYYHVGIFLLDNANQFAVLRAANSEGGQRMLARGHRLQVGATGIVGNVAASGKARIALDTGADAVFFNNPDLPETRSEMALALFAGAKIIGVLDVQSLEKDAFTNEDVEILTILANQVSIAIRNTQLIEEAQRSNAEIRQLLQQDVRAQWLKVVRAQKTPNLLFDGSRFIPLKTDTGLKTDIMNIPIKVRGQTIGRLGIKLSTERKLSTDELDIINAVAERLSISAENARLLEDSQKRAAKEQRIGEITSKIGASINLRSIMQTAVEELGQALPGSEVIINLQTQNDGSTK